MDDVALLTPAHLEPTIGSLALSRLVPLLPPALRRYHILLHKQLDTLSLWAYLLDSAALLWALQATSLIALRAALITRIGLARGLFALGSAAAGAWSSKSVQALRGKLFHEFALFILGCGNSLALVVFWPGWILVGAGILAIRTVSG